MQTMTTIGLEGLCHPRGKNDAADAQAICQAVRKPGMRFVPVKSVEQQRLLMLHAVRDRLVCQRTQVMNALLRPS